MDSMVLRFLVGCTKVLDMSVRKGPCGVFCK